MLKYNLISFASRTFPDELVELIRDLIVFNLTINHLVKIGSWWPG